MTGSCEGSDQCPWIQIGGGKLRRGTHVANTNKQKVQRSLVVRLRGRSHSICPALASCFSGNYVNASYKAVHSKALQWTFKIIANG